MEKRLYIETWGCQMNRHQSEGIAGVLRRAGYRLTDGLADADVVIFNGCMVRQKAEEKVYGRIGAVVEEKRRREVLLGVGGCIGEVRGGALLNRFPAVDFVFGAGGHAGLPELIEQTKSERRRQAATGSWEEIDEVPFVRFSPVTAMVTITEGCSNACTYCIVPRARGPMRSRAPGRILAEVEGAVSAGYREVVLLGQNVNSYGRDRPEFGDFVTLLDRVAAIGPDRVRFTSSHPRDLPAELLEAMASTESLCPHLHVACQSGSDAILRAMNRGYTKGEFLAVVERARATVPGINVTTDLIVGFPGETDADFADSMKLIERGRFGSIFVAKYSPRPETRSARLADDVPEDEKQRRLHVVLERQREIALEQNERLVGRDVDVLIEGATRSGAWYGRAADHRTVVVREETPGSLAAGDLVSVCVEAASSASLSGAALLATVSGASVRGGS
jgi:tRNA-2-methylthio-N6-dimethylallyladenosine synthase